MKDNRRTLANVAVGPQNTPPATGPVIVRHATLEPGYRIPAPPADIIRLTDAQLDGVACIRCARTDAPMVPAGSGEHGQLFECADHAPAAYPCPAWCTAGDHGGDEPGERAHYTSGTDVSLSLEAPIAATPAPLQPTLMADLVLAEGNVSGRGAHIVLSTNVGRWERRLTLAEADKFANGLHDLTAQASGEALTGAEADELGRAAKAIVARRTVLGPVAPGCKPWCVDHDDCTSGGRHPANPQGGMCRAMEVPVPGGRSGTDGHIALTYDGLDGPLIQVANDSDASLTVDEAEQLANAILAQVANARRPVSR